MTDNLPLLFGLIGVVVVISALLSGFIEKTNFPQVAVFLGLGAAVGPFGFSLLNVGLDSSMLQMVATLSLALVLFTDALTIDLKEVRQHAGLASLILGPGTLIAAGVMTLAGVILLKLSVPMAAILAAALASTDPVMLRNLLKRPDLPAAARQGLRLESGLNDIVLLPIVLISMAFATPAQSGEHVSIGKLLLQMLIVGPGAGALVAWVGIVVLDKISKKVGIRRNYESLYSIGIALTAYAAAESLHGSGFLAVFAAGLMISSIDVELCDCFREYGETTAEILLLFTFVLMGTSLIWAGISAITLSILLFVVVALLARPLGLLLSLGRAKTDANSKKFIIWYGPRGLSTLLLVLVPVFAGTPKTSPLFHIATVIVLVSVALHGGTMMFFGNRADKLEAEHHHGEALSADDTPPPAPTVTATVVENPILKSVAERERVTPEEIRALVADGEKVWLVDVRRQDPYIDSPDIVKGAVRVHPQHGRREAELQGIPKSDWAVLYCNCPNDVTSERVAAELRGSGWSKAFAVQGGWDALLASGFETEPKPEA